MLVSLYQGFARESEWICKVFLRSISELNKPNPLQPAMNRLAAEMAIIRLHDSWDRFCRELVVLSAGAKPMTARGLQTQRTSGVKRIRDVIPILLKSYPRNRTREPNWAIASDSIDAAQRLKVSNFNEIAAALGAANSPADDLRVVRNFFAHRGQDTIRILKQQSWYTPGMRLTVENIAAMPILGGITLFENWVKGLQSVAREAIQ